jgi:hypothetical protein
LLGKLASPLKKVVAEHFQKELPLDVSWSMHDFEVSLKPTQLGVAVIK